MNSCDIFPLIRSKSKIWLLFLSPSMANLNLNATARFPPNFHPLFIHFPRSSACTNAISHAFGISFIRFSVLPLVMRSRWWMPICPNLPRKFHAGISLFLFFRVYRAAESANKSEANEMERERVKLLCIHQYCGKNT